MRQRPLWRLGARVGFILLLCALPVSCVLSLFSFMWYQWVVAGVGLLLIYTLLAGILQVRSRLVQSVLGAAVVLVVLAAAFYGSPRFNFWLTAAARQRVVDTITATDPWQPQDSSYPRALLGAETVYVDQGQVSVYFDFYKIGDNANNQAAFFVYTSDPHSIERNHLVQLTQLKEHWFFLVRGYAD